MKVYLDNFVFSLQRTGGATNWWSHLLEIFTKDPDLDITIVERPDAATNLSRNQMDLSDQKIINPGPAQLRMAQVSRVKTEGKCIFHSSYFRSAKGDGCINIATIHDFICMYCYSGFLKHYSIWEIRRAALRADGIIAISESTKRDLLKFVPEVKDKPIVIVPQGFDNVSYTYKEVPRKRQVVFIGNRKVKYKNFEKAVEAAALMDEDISLIIIGAPLKDTEKEFVESRLAGRYTSVEYPSATEISAIFNESLALLNLSEYEGFGIPLVEAMAAGLPVIALNRSAMPEVCGHAAFLLDDADPKLVAAAFKEIDSDPQLFDTMVKNGLEQATHFSWERTARETKAFYEYMWNRNN